MGRTVFISSSIASIRKATSATAKTIDMTLVGSFKNSRPQRDLPRRKVVLTLQTVAGEPDSGPVTGATTGDELAT